MAEKVEELPGDLLGNQNSVLAQRRCIILAVVGSTPTNSTSLEYILSSGFLNTVKLWLDQILSGSVGEFLVLLRSHTMTVPMAAAIVYLIFVFVPRHKLPIQCHIHRRNRSDASSTFKHHQTTGNEVDSQGIWDG
jgi:hypothetical protein